VAGIAGDHRVQVATLGLDVVHEFERGALAAERHLVDDAAQSSVVVLVARPQHVDALDHGRVLGPAGVVLEQRPDPGPRMWDLEGVAVLAHQSLGSWWSGSRLAPT